MACWEPVHHPGRDERPIAESGPLTSFKRGNARLEAAIIPHKGAPSRKGSAATALAGQNHAMSKAHHPRREGPARGIGSPTIILAAKDPPSGKGWLLIAVGSAMAWTAFCETAIRQESDFTLASG